MKTKGVVVPSHELSQMVINLWEGYYHLKSIDCHILAENLLDIILKYGKKLETNGYWEGDNDVTT
jgi:hypothetical protein